MKSPAQAASDDRLLIVAARVAVRGAELAGIDPDPRAVAILEAHASKTESDPNQLALNLGDAAPRLAGAGR